MIRIGIGLRLDLARTCRREKIRLIELSLIEVHEVVVVGLELILVHVIDLLFVFDHHHVLVRSSPTGDMEVHMFSLIKTLLLKQLRPDDVQDLIGGCEHFEGRLIPHSRTRSVELPVTEDLMMVESKACSIEGLA